MTDQTVPPGFAPHPRKSPLTAPWEPLWSRRDGDRFIIGLHVAEPHTNARGLAHGGLIAALADNAMGLACAVALGGNTGLVTVNLSLDLLGAVRIGQWLEFDAVPVRTGGTLCFAEARIIAAGDLAAKASGIFRVLETR